MPAKYRLFITIQAGCDGDAGHVKTTFGETMRDIWVKHRLGKAQGIVAYEREKKIKEIGAGLGFLSVSNFSKTFISAYGCSSRAARRDEEAIPETLLNRITFFCGGSELYA